MGSACGTYMREKKMHAGLWLENLKVRNKLEVIGVEGRIILKRIFKE
jgi:hypothetical protein